MKYLRNDPVLKQRRKDLRRDQTEAETIFWSRVRDKQFRGMKFFRQFSVGPYILDFYCPGLKLAVELDGGQHSERGNLQYDEERSEYLKANGLEVIRFPNHEVLHDIEAVLTKLAKRLQFP